MEAPRGTERQAAVRCRKCRLNETVAYACDIVACERIVFGVGIVDTYTLHKQRRAPSRHPPVSSPSSSLQQECPWYCA